MRIVNSIQGRLTLYIVAGTALVLVVVGFVVDAQLSRQLENEFNRSLLAKAMTMVTLTEQDRGVVEFDLVEELAPEFTPGERAEYVQLLYQDGTVLSRSSSLGHDLLSYGAPELDTPAFEDIVLPDGRAGRLVSFKFVPIDDSSEDGPSAADEGAGEDDESSEVSADDDESSEAEADTAGGMPADALPGSAGRDSGPDQEILIDLVLAQGKEPLTDLLTTMRSTLLLSFVLLMVLLAGLARVSIGVGMRPLRRIAREVEHIGAANLHERVSEEYASTELRPVAHRLNDLLSRLEEAFDREKRFSGNVAHELRTPIAELRALAEVGKEWPSEREMVEGFFGDLVDLADDMERTVANLLMLARLDAGTQDVRQESIDPAGLVDSIIERFSDQVAEKSLRFRNQVPAGVTVMTDKDKLKLILINVIYNALTYSPVASEITIQARQVNAHVELSVSNDAVDLDQRDVSMMFERFWRKEQARSGGSHAGLGLSLVTALAELLDLKVRLMLDAGSRFTFSLSGLATSA